MTKDYKYNYLEAELNPLFRLSNALERQKGTSHTTGRHHLSNKQMLELNGVDTTDLTDTQMQLQVARIKRTDATKDLSNALHDYSHRQETQQAILEDMQRNNKTPQQQAIKQVTKA